MSQELIDYIRKVSLMDEHHPCYNSIRIMKDGNIAYMERLAFTWAVLLVSEDEIRHSTSYRYRFCFPNIKGAFKFLNSVEDINTIPTEDWVAARPENRILLPRDIIHYLPRERIKDYQSNTTIEQLISDKLYTASMFKAWLADNKRDISSLKKGELDFLTYLESLETEP